VLIVISIESATDRKIEKRIVAFEIDKQQEIMSGKSTSNRINDHHLPQHLVLRSFRSAEDDKACCALELRANQHKNTKRRTIPIVGPLYGLFADSLQVHQAHVKGFDAMAREGAEENEIIVCEDNSNKENTVVAVIVCNVRTVVWSGKPIKVGLSTASGFTKTINVRESERPFATSWRRGVVCEEFRCCT